MEKCKRFKRLLSLVLAFVMVFSMLPMPRVHAAEDGTALYLKPNSNWLEAGARFAAYYWNDSGDNWLDMTDADADGYYEVTIPAGYSNLIFCRMNPGVTDNNWDNRWNQTSNLTVPTDGTNCYTVAEGAWSEGDGAWSVYTPSVVEPEEPTTEPVVTGDTYVVAGVAELCGTAWDMANTANTMTANGDGTYTKVYTSVPVGQSYQFKVVKNGSEWIGDSSGNNVTFNVSAVCDVTITFNSADNSITVTGDGVNFEQTTSFDSIHVVGNGSGNWLNGAEWDTTANAMTETSTGVYEITFENVAAGSYEFKFAANGSWADNWGNDGSEAVVGQPAAANYNGQNITLTVSYALADVTLKLDLSGYDYTAKTGATYSVTVVEVTEKPEEPEEPEVPAVDYYLYGYVNGADISGNEETYKFVDGKLTASFTTADNYVFVKDSNGTSYMAEAYCTDTTVTLATGNSEKMLVPGNLELEFTLVVNEDGTLTLSYAEVTPKTTVTIHFLRPDAWGTGINAYVWTAAGALAGYSDYNTWPGKAVSENASHPGWYDFVAVTDEPTAFNFIFNDGGNQTADLATGDVTGDTELWVVDNDVLTEAPGQWSGDYDYTVYFHFLKPDSWQDTIHAYVWDAAGNTVLGAWPGTAAEADSVNSGWYNASVTMAENAAINFIFNDNNGNQTGDLATGTLEVTTHIWIVDGAAQTTAPEGWVDPNMTVHVPGTFPGPSWDAASNRMDYYPNLGLYALTFEDVPAGNYEFKIAINGSWNENYGAGGVANGSNIAVTVPETMDVTVYYSPVTHIAVTDVTYKFTMAAVTGTGIEDTALVDPGLTGIYSGTVYMAAGTYTDVVILEGDNTYAFDEIVLEEGKDVTFYLDPVTGIFYCDASAAPVDTASIYFSSQDNECKTPFGAVEEGEEVSFAIKTGSDITSAVLVIKGLDSYPMTAEETATGKTWSVTTAIANMGEYDYYFVLSNGSSVVVYGDDDGFYGEGTVTDLTSVMPYDLVVYEAGFETPDWMKNAVIYQIFPDRFFDGDESNNRAQTWARGAVDYEYITDWYTLPENPEQESMLTEEQYLSHGAHFGDGEWSNEIYGGDLKGITQRIDYLKALGVNVIYLNPVFWSISNHRYDAVDYTEIDPILGTLGDFEELVAVAEANGMHIILDGVFNHVSDDSVYFDRYYKFLPDAAEKYDGKVGAYPYWAYVYDTMAADGITQAEAETKAKTYFSENYGITDYSYTQWFAVSSTTMAGSADTIGLRAGKEVYSYEGWWGYDSMPVIYSTNGSEYQTGNWAQEIISGSNSVNAYWIGKGMDGWRLDVANEVSDETWQNFRDSVKALNSEAVIIGEIWDDATKYLMGDMYDSVMNYLFRNASTAFAMGTGAEATAKALEKIRERYPEEAFYAMMNLVGSHDTTRLLSYLDGIGDDRADKTEAAAFPTYETTSQLAKDRQYLVSFLQFTYAGAPTVYYGDEIGMVGSDDPDDRRAFEWGKGNQELVEWYARLAAVRGSYTALRTGTVEPIDADNNSLLAYVRSDAEATLLVIANNSTSAQTYALGYDAVDLVTGEAYTGTVPAMSGVILAAAEDAKTITVNTAALAPAYDPAYIVAERSAEYHEHEWTDATCTAPKTCASCGETEGEALGHDYVDGVCSRCGDNVIVYVAQLESTGEKYETLQAALDAANLAFQNGTTAETVTLIGDTTECVSVTWKTSKVSITIDLNGHTVTGDGTGSVFYLNSSSGVSNVAHVFADSVGTGVVTGGVGFTNSTSNYGGAIYVNSAACLLTINGGTFSGNTAALGGAIDNRKSATVINGGTFTGNTATKCGGAINASNLTINGGVITGNTANGEVTETSTPRASAGGGGIYVTGSNSVLTISGGKVYGNTAVAWGDDIVYVNTNKSSTAALTLADAATMGADNVTGWYVDGLNGAYNNVSGRTERYSVNCTVEHTDLTMDSTETQRYAVALKAAVPAYTVTYTDGVEDVEVFADQVYNVWGGEATPAFNGTPARAGYVFKGWTPETAETVTESVTYTAQWAVAVAQLESTGEKYETLQAALDAANVQLKEGGSTAETVTLLADTTECVGVTWAAAAVSTVTIDLNGHTVTGDGTSSVFYFVKGAGSAAKNISIVINDSVGTGKVTGGVGYENGGTLKGGAIFVNSSLGGTLTINGGTFCDNTATVGGAVHSIKTNVIINGGTFTGNTAKSGGAIYAANLTINGGEITGNTANGPVDETSTGVTTAGGGGITVRSSEVHLTITGGKIYGNTADGWADDILYMNTSARTTSDMSLTAASNMGAEFDGWYVDGLNGTYKKGRTDRFGEGTIVEFTDLTLDGTGAKQLELGLKAASTYTVTYTDGVEGEEVFADQVILAVPGEATPAFDGTPAREGFNFEGWTPEVAETVTADVTYTATWSCAHVWTDATCTTPKTCSVCGETEGAALGHKDENADYICDVCGEDLCTEHTEEVIPGKAATCTETGLTEGVKCSVCGDILVAQEEIPALGHTYEDGVCTVCGEADPDYVKPLEGVIRIAGADRIETSLKLADQLKEALGVEKFQAVVVASGLNFPDALTGSYLAAVKNAPILLTAAGWEDKVNTYITENLAEGGTVYVLGGAAVVPEALLEGLTGVKRLAGENRFGTNLAILEEAGVNETQEILICTATGFADSLAASASGLPILLVHGSLTAEQKTFLETTSKDFVIIGGEAAVSADLAAELDAIGDVERVGGENRYKTSVLVAQRFVAEPDAVILAYARNYPDGLCGGPLAYALHASLILTDNYDPSAADGYVDGISAGVVVGGEGLISDGAAKAIFDLTADAQITAK